MKPVIALVLLFAGGFVVVGLGSQYVLNGIDGGMHHGESSSRGAFELTEYQKMRQRRQRELREGTAAKPSYAAPAAVEPGEVNANPFAN